MEQEQKTNRPTRRRTRVPQGTGTEQPYVEQFSDILLVRNKDDPKTGIRAVSGTDEKGNIQTVPADEKHENSFLKFDKRSSILENFIRNFWSQLKEPTHFQLLRMTFEDYKRNKQALKDLAAGKKTDTVREFLKHYEIRPRNNQKEESTTINKNTNMAQNVEQQTGQGKQQPDYRYDEAMIDWKSMEKVGVSKDLLVRMNLLDGMLRGYKTNKLVPLNINIEGVVRGKADARLSFTTDANGQVVLAVHGIRQKPELNYPYYGHIFKEDEKKTLLETGNLGHAVDLLLPGSNSYEPCLVSIDRDTNELVCVRQSQVYIHEEVKGVKFNEDEITKLKNGEPLYVEGMISEKGKEFNATLQYNAERRGLEFIFPQNKLENMQTIGGVKLNVSQLKLLSEGKPFLVEDMKRRDGTTFTSYVIPDLETQKLSYSRIHPETGEICIPKEICHVALTTEDMDTLRKGQPVFLENMISKSGREFSNFVRINQQTGALEFSKTPDGFQERKVPEIPETLYGHKFTAKEKAALQDGKSLLVTDLTGNDGKTFSRYVKASPSGNLNYYTSDPDVRRNITPRTTQNANNQSQEVSQKRGRAV